MQKDMVGLLVDLSNFFRGLDKRLGMFKLMTNIKIHGSEKVQTRIVDGEDPYLMKIMDIMYKFNIMYKENGEVICPEKETQYILSFIVKGNELDCEIYLYLVEKLRGIGGCLENKYVTKEFLKAFQMALVKLGDLSFEKRKGFYGVMRGNPSFGDCAIEPLQSLLCTYRTSESEEKPLYVTKRDLAHRFYLAFLKDEYYGKDPVYLLHFEEVHSRNPDSWVPPPSESRIKHKEFIFTK